MVCWRKNLLATWLSQFLAMLGFSISLPFAPYYIQALGVTDPDAVKFWAGMTVSAAALGLAVMSPVWGMLADRYGRKMMMLRANLSGTVILLLMGMAPNVFAFVGLRALQGMFTGTMAAAVTLIACGTPDDRQGFALGSLSAAVFSGATVGQFAGGMLADTIGYRNTFFVASGALVLATIIIFFAVRESFVREPPPARKLGYRERFVALGPGTSLLLLVAYASMARRFDGPFLPLFVQDLHGQLQGAARWTGALNGVAGIGAMLAGLVVGHLSDRHSPERLGKIAALGSAVGMMFIAVCPSLGLMFPLRFIAIFFAGSIDPVLNAWISRTTPEAKRGSVFGLSVTAKASGWILAPLLGAFIAMHAGIRWVFVATAVLCVSMVPVISWVGYRINRNIGAREQSVAASRTEAAV